MPKLEMGHCRVEAGTGSSLHSHQGPCAFVSRPCRRRSPRLLSLSSPLPPPPLPPPPLLSVYTRGQTMPDCMMLHDALLAMGDAQWVMTRPTAAAAAANNDDERQ